MLEFNATFLVAMFSFVVFIFIMNAIFYRPILNIVRKREDYIDSNYQEAKNNEASAKSLTEERDIKISQTQEKCRQEFQKTIGLVQEEVAKKLKLARDNTRQMIQDRKLVLQDDEQNLKSQLKSNIVGQLATEIENKIMAFDVSVEKK